MNGYLVDEVVVLRLVILASLGNFKLAMMLPTLSQPCSRRLFAEFFSTFQYRQIIDTESIIKVQLIFYFSLINRLIDF